MPPDPSAAVSDARLFAAFWVLFSAGADFVLTGGPFACARLRLSSIGIAIESVFHSFSPPIVGDVAALFSQSGILLFYFLDETDSRYHRHDRQS